MFSFCPTFVQPSGSEEAGAAQWSQAAAAVAEVVPHEDAEMVDDADIRGHEQVQSVVCGVVVGQLFDRARNKTVVADATRAREDDDSGRCPKVSFFFSEKV